MRGLGILAVLVVVAVLVGLLSGGGEPDPPRPPDPSDPVPAPAAAPPEPDRPAEIAEPPVPAPAGQGSLVVTVLDTAGAPLADARLYVPGHGSRSAPEGEGRYPGLSPGPVTVQASAPGHPPVEAGAVIRPDAEVRIDLVLIPGGHPLGGRVIDDGGRPVPGATVHVLPIAPGRASLRQRLETGPDGRFEASGFPRGRYRLSAVAPFATRAHAVEADAGRTDVVLTIRPAGEIEVRVAGRPDVRDVEFLLRTGEGELATWWDWSEDATWLAKGLAPGPYLVLARDGEGRTARAEVVVVAGERKLLALEMGPGETLRGRVVRRDGGEPVAGAIVAATENDGPAMTSILLEPDTTLARLNGALTARTDEEGRYELVGLHPGPWLLAAHAPGHEPVVIEGVEVPGAGPEFRLPLGGSIQLEVLDGVGDPVPGAIVTVVLENVGGTYREAETGADGRCTIEGLPPGKRDVSVQVGYVDWFASRSVTVTAGERAAAVIRLPRGEARLVGRIVRDGAPLAARQVSVEQQDAATGTTFQFCTRTDELGRFRVGNLVSGGAALRHDERSWFGPVRRRLDLEPGENLVELDLASLGLLLRIVDAETREPLRATAGARGSRGQSDGRGRIRLTGLSAEEVEVVVTSEGHGPARIRARPARDPEEITVALEPAVRVTLRVVGDDGRPVAGAAVSVLDPDGWDLYGAAEDWFTSQPLAGSRVLELSPGRYTLRVEAPGRRPIEETLLVPVPGGERTVVLVRD